MQKPAHQHFGPGIFALNAAHIKTTYCAGVHVGHRAKIDVSERGLKLSRHSPGIVTGFGALNKFGQVFFEQVAFTGV
jgi:hypothetical protein